jgi:hypothetical protein
MSIMSLPVDIPRAHHYPGRPLPTIPNAPPPILRAPAASASTATITQSFNAETRDHTHQRAANVPEGLLINLHHDEDDDDSVGPVPNASSSSIGTITSESSSDLVALRYALGINFNPGLYHSTADARTSTSSPPSPSALVGRIEIESPRYHWRGDNRGGSSSSTSSDHGLIKFKLSLLGVIVESCGICLSQFEEGELAALGVGCQHA